MRKLFHYFCISLLLFSFFLAFKHSSFAAVPYEASDVLGQPNFTTGDANFGMPNVNSQGFSYPNSTAIDTVHHRLFVSDSSNNRILIFNLDNDNVLVDYTADNVLGQSDFESSGHSTTAASLYCWYEYSCGIAYDDVHNRLFVTDNGNSRVLVFDLSTLSNGEDAVHVLGQADFTSGSYNRDGDYNNVTINGLSEVSGIAIDTVHDRLFVVDGRDNNRILVYNVSPNIISNGMDASYVIGQPDFNSKSIGLSDTEIYCTWDTVCGVAYDPNYNRLFLADQGNARVLIFDTTTISNGEAAINVLCQTSFDSDTSDVSRIGCGNVMSVEYDRVNNIAYVVDTYSNNRILLFDANDVQNGEEAIAVLGQVDFTSNTYPFSPTQSSINTYALPNMGLDVVNNTLYIGDDSFYRVNIYRFINLPTSLSTSIVGNSYSQSLAATQSQGTVTYELVSGTLPPGLSFNTTSALLSGTPTTLGTYTFTIKGTDDNGAIGYFFDTQEYTLTVSGSGSGGSSPRPEGEYSTTEAPVCRYTSPLSAPNLFNLQRTGTDVLLHFTPIPSNTSYYFISYGTDTTAEGYSLEIPQPIDTTGAISQDIHMLNPNKTYYFKVRAGNNCMPGPWSSVVK